MQVGGVPAPRPEGRVCPVSLAGREIRFLVADETDHIQSLHAAGAFYEPEEIALIGAHFPRGGTFVDIGANVGNHTVFVATFLRPARVHVFEPHPLAAAILRANVELNGLERVVDLAGLGLGLSDRPGRASAYTPATNLGATRLSTDDPAAPIELTTGDLALAGRPVDFIKLDAEGMELRVLEGLSDTIRRSRPTMLIEVDDENAAPFGDWLLRNRYRVLGRFRRYAVNENYLVAPRRSPGDLWRRFRARWARLGRR